MLKIFFSFDSSFTNIINKIIDIIWLNIITCICCIPIITIGASLTSMYTVSIKLANDEESYITKTFFAAFKQNFKQSTVVWIIILLCLCLSAANIKIVENMPYKQLLLIIFGVVTIIILVGTLYIFPVLARYENTLKNAIKNSYIYAIACFPKTIFLLIVQIIPIMAAYVMNILTIYTLICGLALPSYMCAKIFMSIFEKFELAPPKK